MNNVDQMERMLRQIVDNNGYAFACGYSQSLVIEMFAMLPKSKQKIIAENLKKFLDKPVDF